MGKQPPTTEWHIAENEAEWARLAIAQTDHTTSLTAQHLSFYKNACWTLAFVLGLLLALGGWWWPTESADAQRMAADYNSLVAALMRDHVRPVVLNDSSMLTGIPTGASITQLEPVIVIVEAQGEQAVVSFVTTSDAGRLSCREQRLYHHGTSGWQQTVLDEKVVASLRQQKTAPTNLGSICN